MPKVSIKFVLYNAILLFCEKWFLKFLGLILILDREIPIIKWRLSGYCEPLQVAYSSWKWMKFKNILEIFQAILSGMFLVYFYNFEKFSIFDLPKFPIVNSLSKIKIASKNLRYNFCQNM